MPPDSPFPLPPALEACDPDRPLPELSALPAPSQGPERPARAVPPLARRPLTLLMADLQGLEDGMQTLAAEACGDWLERYLGPLAEIIHRHQGWIDHVTGHSIMAVFGLPAAQADDTERALVCAIEMQQAMRDLDLEHLGQHLPQMFMGIGVCAGQAMAGRLASDPAAACRVLGDLVALTSQIRALSLRGQVMVSEATYAQASRRVSAAAPQQVYLHGRAQPVDVRELVAALPHKLKVPRQEFRRSHRVPLEGPCSVQRVLEGQVQPGRFPARVRNLSYHGVQLALLPCPDTGGLDLAAGSELRLVLTLPDDTEPVRDLAARVVSLLPDGALGLEFVAPSPAFAARLRRCVQQQLAWR